MTTKTESFWTTLPGVLTAIAALITAVGGIYLAQKPDEMKPKTDLITGKWNFTMSSTVPNNMWKITGTLVIESSDKDTGTNIKGHIESGIETPEYLKFSNDIKGTYINNELRFYRETTVVNLLQEYDLKFFSDKRFSGEYYNSNNSDTSHEGGGKIEIYK